MFRMSFKFKWKVFISRETEIQYEMIEICGAKIINISVVVFFPIFEIFQFPVSSSSCLLTTFVKV